MSSRPVNTPEPPPPPISPEAAVDILLDMRRTKGLTLDDAVRAHGDIVYYLSKAKLISITAGDRREYADGVALVHYVSLTPEAYELLARHRASFR